MARIRTIKPEFWTSEQVAACSPLARLLFIGLWNFADDGGVHPDSAKRLKMEVFPGDDLTIANVQELLAELVAAGLLDRFSAQGKDWLQVTGWEHQLIRHPTTKYPQRQCDSNAVTMRYDCGNDAVTMRQECGNATASLQSGREGKGREYTHTHTGPPEIFVVRENAEKLAKKLDVALTPQNRATAWIAAHVAAEHLPAGELDRMAASAVSKRKRDATVNVYAYVQSAVKGELEKLGLDPHAEWRKVKVPAKEHPPPKE